MIVVVEIGYPETDGKGSLVTRQKTVDVEEGPMGLAFMGRVEAAVAAEMKRLGDQRWVGWRLQPDWRPPAAPGP